MAEWPLQDAKNKFSAAVNAALAGEPQRVTRRGQPAVVVVATEEYERLCRLEKPNAPTLGELLLEIPQDDEEFERLSLATSRQFEPAGGCYVRSGRVLRTWQAPSAGRSGPASAALLAGRSRWRRSAGRHIAQRSTPVPAGLAAAGARCHITIALTSGLRWACPLDCWPRRKARTTARSLSSSACAGRGRRNGTP